MMRCSLSFALVAEVVFITVRVMRSTLLGMALLIAASGLWVQTVVAQETAQDTAEADDAEAEAGEAGGIEMMLKTKDGVQLSCVYYEGPIDKTTIPVVLIHGWKGQSSDYHDFAVFLQSEKGGGHSVIVPDLRGHGESTVLKPAGSDKSIELNSKRTGKAEFQAMVKLDMEAVKTFLMGKHKEGALNIDALTVVGGDMGALVALYWAAQDWSWPPLAGVKQGQDVKAVVLLSPPTSFKGLTPQIPLKQPDLQKRVSMLMLYGGDNAKASSGVSRMYNTVKRHRKQNWKDDEEKRAKKDLFLVPLETSLQGVELLARDAGLPTPRIIAQFIHGRVRVRMEEEFPWKERRRATE